MLGFIQVDGTRISSKYAEMKSKPMNTSSLKYFGDVSQVE